MAVYAVVPGRAILRGGGLVDFTGGEVFATSYDVEPAIDRILSDASLYYMLGYCPVTGSKPREMQFDRPEGFAARRKSARALQVGL